MQPDNPLEAVANIQAAIDYEPLILHPSLSVREAVQRMSNRVHISATSEGDRGVVVSSCALVVENDQLVGIFTERDIVLLSANGNDIDNLTVGEIMNGKVVSLPLSGFRDLFGALFLFRRYQVRHLPIIGDRGEIIGVISSESLRKIIRPEDFLKLRRVGEVMTTPVICAPLQASLTEIAQIMTFSKVSCVVIVEIRESYGDDGYEFPVGVITERDLVHFKSCYVDFDSTTAELVMSTPLLLLSPEDSLWTAHQEMQRLRVRRLIVSWDWGKGLGIVTLSNLLRLLDPVEMYMTKEVVTQAIGGTPRNPPRIQANPEVEAESPIKKQLRQLIAEIQTHLVNTAQNRDIPKQVDNVELVSAITKLKRLQALLENFDPPDKPSSTGKPDPKLPPNDFMPPIRLDNTPVDDETPRAVNHWL